ncbi:bifunctional UDP-N-acetylglucosamine diphosphorylase/glucosamine-1-phosphate N-acetyltransferase GlmU [uncultured Friedmanniella sp.]|uniref:bifunctional UDP-N-acetylglucosamine diphosphorylase/glucosamine-1-phosphate N-acetyltransferase GlmU n=1 Tax=uncultured Friedmanniella sp. TaxID=335381 RepID=UPI0035C99F4E
MPGPLDSPPAAVIVLAAGGGTRMRSSRSKLLHELGGHSMLSYAVTAATLLQPEHVVVVVGHQREQVLAHLAEVAPHATAVVQEEQRGTGHAVQVALAALPALTGEVVVTYGDVPLLTGDTLTELVAAHRAEQATVTVLTAQVGDPTGYGRVLRDRSGHVEGIVEHRDADEDQRRITEINSGIYVFQADTLAAGLAGLQPDNSQGELYLTDVIGSASAAGGTVAGYPIEDVWQVEGVNDRIQLSRLNAELNRRTLERWMRAGVTVVDPATTWVHASVDLGTDVTLLPGTSLEGATSVAAGAVIGPDTTLADVEVGAGAHVVRTQGSLSVIGADASVGPFAYLRPGTNLGPGGKIGTFVETKNARIGAHAKVPHLTYAGDTEIGEEANIGAGVIFANYDGVAKTSSRVGRASFVGSDSVLVHPVEVADGAYVAAGSTITGHVGVGELAVARGTQRNIRGWVARKRAGTKTARAAAAAQARQDEQTQDEQIQDEQTQHEQQHHGGTES